MLYDALKPAEAAREMERVEYELEKLQASKTKSDRQRELKGYLKQLRQIAKRRHTTEI